MQAAHWGCINFLVMPTGHIESNFAIMDQLDSLGLLIIDEFLEI